MAIHLFQNDSTQAPQADVPQQRITVLGSTGSVGTSTLDVISRHKNLSVYALSAGSNAELLFRQCLQFKPRIAVLLDEAAAEKLQQRLFDAGSTTKVESGPESLSAVASAADVDTVMAAIVGAAGLPPALAAASSGKKVLLANKEALVMAGALFMQAAERSGAVVLPIDSEHNAIFQCLPPAAQQSGEFADRAGVRLVQQLPHGRGHGHHRHDRHEVDGPVDLHATQRAVDEHREPQRQRRLDRYHHRREGDVVDQRTPEDAVAEHRDVVVDADERGRQR